MLGSHRGQGIGTALLLRSLRSMSEAGYAHAVIGNSGADDFYTRTVGTIPIEGSTPGPYHHPIRRD
jgi:predicted N-acetyltransferase YhbS